jgi:hypothetical protein
MLAWDVLFLKWRSGFQMGIPVGLAVKHKEQADTRKFQVDSLSMRSFTITHTRITFLPACPQQKTSLLLILNAFFLQTLSTVSEMNTHPISFYVTMKNTSPDHTF